MSTLWTPPATLFGQLISLKLRSGGQSIATAFLLQPMACALYLGIRQSSSIKEKKAEWALWHLLLLPDCTAVQNTAWRLLQHHPPLRFIQKPCLDSKRGCKSRSTCKKQEDSSRTVLEATDAGDNFLPSLWGFLETTPCQAPLPQRQLWGILQCFTHAICWLVQSHIIWVHRHHLGVSFWRRIWSKATSKELFE